MEHKLYYDDAYIKTFSAKLLKQAADESGHWFVVLDRTAFYPTGGGQPSDTGTINDINVLNVEEIGGEIRHFIEQPLPEQTKEVQGFIDWARRFDHMQQHAGQHILSAAFEELFGFQTVSFHLGSEELTIDITTEQLTEQQVFAVEERANQIILENRTIQQKWVTPEEAASLPLRKQLSVTKDIRLVIIPDFDYNGCGGTHPTSTAQVGSVKILNWERQKKNIRVSFVCGIRVLNQLGKKHHILQQLSPLLNSPEQEMKNAVTKLLDTMKEKDKALEATQETLLQYEGKELLQTQSLLNGKKVISQVFQNRSIQELQKLGKIITTEAPDSIAIIVSVTQGKLQIVCARGQDAEGSMKKIMAELLSIINGKGGGNDTFAQGGGEATIPSEQILERALALLSPEDDIN